MPALHPPREHPVPSAITGFTCMFQSPNFREVSLEVLISAPGFLDFSSSAPGFLDFFLVTAS